MTKIITPYNFLQNQRMKVFDNIGPPKKFVGLHAHSGFSSYDGLGYPKDHIDFITSEAQGMDAWALTDHGNGSGLAHAQAHANKLKKQGKKYRQIHGVEFYFVPSLDEWKTAYDNHRREIREAKSEKEQQELLETKPVEDNEDELEQGGHIIEDEDATKAERRSKPLWQRYYHLVVLAKNRTGINNLFQLVKKSYKEGFYRFPRIDYEMLKEHSEGLIVSTACVGGYASSLIYRHFPDKAFDQFTPDLVDDPDVAQQIMLNLQNMADRFVDAVGYENFFLEMQFNKLPAQHLTNRCLLELSRKTGIPLITTADSHFPSPDRWQARELYKKLGWMGSKVDQSMLPKREDLKCLLYPKNAQQMWDEYKDGYSTYDFYEGSEEEVKDAIERTHDIAWQMCEDAWIDTSVKLPILSYKNETPFQKLVRLGKEGLIREGLADKPEYVERLKYELGDIKHLGHESYFLTMYDIFKKAEEKTLLGPGRGSATGSLLTFLLGITQIDPIPHGLLWNRFLGRHRVSFPDIDSDAGDRDVLIDAARELYGEDAVIPVSNFNTLKLKSLVKDISKFYGIDFSEVNKVTGPLQDEVMKFAKDENQEKSVFVLKHEDCMQYSPAYKAFMEKYPEVEQHVKTLFMQNKSIGRHAGGVIIADQEELSKTMPIIGVRGELQTPWTEGMNFRNLEDNGFLKFDFLGLTLLKDVENCIYRILKKKGNKKPTFTDAKKFFDENLNCRYNKQDDPRVYEHVYHQRRKTGVFQFTNEGARRFCEDAKPVSIEELATLTAIYRPGPLKANVHRKYIEARDRMKKGELEFDHPIIKELLGPTAGFTIFQEQFMELARRLGGFTPAESDQLRKTLVKKSLDTLGKKSGEREEAKKKFIEGAQKLHGLSPSITEPLWQTIEFMSVYCFNKAHSVAYAIDSYYAAWLHTYYETDWLATILQSENGNPKDLTKAIAEIKAMGYKFAPTDINHSGNEWIYNEDLEAFVPPLTSIKGVGKTAMRELLQTRPYKNLTELFFNDQGEWRHSKVNKTALASLCKIEAMSSLEEFKSGLIHNHKQLLLIMSDGNNYNILRKGMYGLTPARIKKAIKNNESLVPIIDKLIEKYVDVEDWTRHEKINNFIDITSSIDADLIFPPLLMKKILEKNVKSIHDIEPREKGIGWFCAAEIINKKTKNGKDFSRVRVIDDEHRTKWLRVWGQCGDVLQPYTMWLAEVSNDPNWGMSTSSYKMKKIEAYE